MTLSLNKRRSRHLLLTASAFAAGTAQGSVDLHDNVNITIQPNPNGIPDQIIDLNGDGAKDFHFNFGKNSGKQPYLDPENQPKSGPATGNAILTKGNVNDTTDRGLTVTIGGTLIDSTAFEGHNGRSSYFNANFGNDNEIVGDWGGGGTVTGFVGLRVPSLDLTDYQYGWANFTYNSASGSESLTLNSYAVETNPGVGITTPVPEPSAITCLAMGAAGLVAMRRRRAAH
jgi:hypothetical protein